MGLYYWHLINTSRTKYRVDNTILFSKNSNIEQEKLQMVFLLLCMLGIESKLLFQITEWFRLWQASLFAPIEKRESTQNQFLFSFRFIRLAEMNDMCCFGINRFHKCRIDWSGTKALEMLSTLKVKWTIF